MRLAIVGEVETADEAGVEPDGPFAERLAERTSDVTIGPPKPDTDIVFLAADSDTELEALASLRPLIRIAGAIWVVSRKGKAATVRQGDVIAAAKAHDLVDNKAVAFSATRTGLRLVIPVALRPKP